MASRSLNQPGHRTKIITVALGCALVAGGLLYLVSCDEPPKTDSGKPTLAEKEPKLEPVTIAGKEFKLEPALDEATRFKGLSGREDIKPDGGMLFVFTRAEQRHFVMRDCPIGIDIIFLDATGRITAFHKMVPEEPRAEDEKKLSPPFLGADAKDWINQKYEARLHQYGSKYSAQFVIELKANTLDGLKIQEGDQVQLDVAGLKKRAK